MKIRIFTILVLAISILCSCGKSNEDTQNQSKLIVGTSADNPPYEFVNDGKIVGFDMDLAELIANELGLELVIKNLDFPGLLPSLLSNNVDIVIAALSITNERLENVDFSTPYSSTEMSVLYVDGLKITSNQDLYSKVIGVQFGTTWEEYAKKLVGSKGGNIKSLANNISLIQELNNKNVDIVIMEKLQAQKFTTMSSVLRFFELPETKAEFAIALPKNSPLTVEVNKALKKLKDDGSIDMLKQKWLMQ